MNKPKRKNQPPPSTPGHKPAPRPSLFVGVVASAFLVAMFMNLINDGAAGLTIFLGMAVLLLLGIDVSKLLGRPS